MLLRGTTMRIHICLAVGIVAFGVAGISSPVLAEMPLGNWIVTSVERADPPPGVKSILNILPDGTVNGSGGCNRYTGRAKFRLMTSNLSFDDIASTEMACDPEVMQWEQRFLAGLGKITRWGKLTIGNREPEMTLMSENRSVIRLVRAPAP